MLHSASCICMHSLAFPDFGLVCFRHFIGINSERATKARRGKTGKMVQKKTQTVNPNVSTLLKDLMDFEWHFIKVS